MKRDKTATVETMRNGNNRAVFNTIATLDRSKELSTYAEQYQAMIATNLFGFMLLDSDGKLLDVNDTYCRISGYNRDELLRLSLPDLEAAESADETVRHIQRLIDFGADQFESRHRAKDGRIVDVEISATYLRSQRSVIVLIRDISDRVKIEEQLRESEELFRTVNDNLSVGVVLINSDMRIQMTNPSIGKMFPGADPTALPPCYRVFNTPKKNEPCIDCPVIKTLQDGRRHVTEKEVPTCSGLRFFRMTSSPVTGPDGNVTAAIKMLEDITEKKRSEEVQVFLAQTSSGTMADESFFNALARYLAQSLGMDFVCIDRLDGDGLAVRTVAVWCDGHFKDNVTYALKNTPCGDVSDKDVSCFPDLCQFFPREQELQDLRTENYFSVTLWSHTGQPIGLITVIGRKPLVNRQLAETTLKMVAVRAAGELERMDAEEALRASEELHRTTIQTALDNARNTNATMQRLLHTVGHEFRTPLGLLIGSTDILDRYWDRLTPEKRFEQNDRIRSAARHMSNLIHSVISFNQLGTDRSGNLPLLLDIGEFCRAIAAEDETVWSAGHTFNVTIAADCGTALLDEVLLRRVLDNLLTNAFRYTPPDGAVSLHVRREKHRLLLKISDTGIGIPEEDQKLIFDAFYRSRNVKEHRGLGLGLSIVQDALSQMGGTITVTSRTGEGTTMWVEIPVDNYGNGEESCYQS